MVRTMGVIQSTIDIRAALDKVFELAIKVEDFPEFMPDVKKVEVRERRPDGYSRSYWEALASIQNIQKTVRWEEEEQWDYQDHTCKFAQTHGDYKHYHGSWKFIPHGDATKVELNVDYDLGLPLIGAIINKLLDKLMKDNCDAMLKGLKAKAEGKVS